MDKTVFCFCYDHLSVSYHGTFNELFLKVMYCMCNLLRKHRTLLEVDQHFETVTSVASKPPIFDASGPLCQQDELTHC